ncbi:DUF3987 domain-containing protein [Phormidesmis sp. 146-33]
MNYPKSKALPTNKGRECPVCGDVGGKCRTFTDKPLVLCMTSDFAPGWKDLGFTRDGLWKQFVPDTGATFDRAAYLDRKREKPAPVTTMSVEERDRWYRAIVGSLELTPEDREYLKSVRRMSDREIELFGARSYRKGQMLTIQVPRDLPGIITFANGEQSLPAAADGIYFPICDERGQWRGLSIRFTEALDGRRYGNCSSKQNPYNLDNADGEQPIAVHFPIDREPTGIAFCEGTGFKPFLAAQRTGKVVIGCSGGNFAGSESQIKSALEFLCDVSKTAVLYPDAGSVQNNQIITQYWRAFELCRALGYELLFAWWGQKAKQQSDVDETSSVEIEFAQLLTWAEFQKLFENKNEVKPLLAQANLRSNVVDFPPLSARSIGDKIRHLLSQNLNQPDLQTEKIELRSQSTLSEREFESLWSSHVEAFEEDSEEFKLEQTQKIDQLLSAQKSELQLDEVLPAQIASPLNQLAKWQNLRPELYLMTMVTTIGSLAQNGTKLVLQRSIGFEVTPNIFTAIVAESSQKKSPVLKAISKDPLRELAKIDKSEFEAKHQDWESRKKAAEVEKQEFKEQEPALPIYYYTKATGESILRQATRVPHRGLLSFSDELAGYFKSLNQYRKGSDFEDLLSFYDGSGGVVLRTDGVKDDVDSLNFGILGAIQPQVLRKLLGDCEDANGGWARFFFIQQPTVASSLPDESSDFDLTGILESIYYVISRYAATEYTLNPQAFRYFQKCYNTLEKRREEESNPALRSVFGKTEGRIGKIALCLHLLESAVRGIEPPRQIEKATIEKAVKISKLAIDQIRSIYGQFDEIDTSPVYAALIDLSERKGSLTARDVQRGCNVLKKSKVDAIRRIFGELVKLGYGSIEGSGIRMRWSIKRSVPVSDNASPTIDHFVGDAPTNQEQLPTNAEVVALTEVEAVEDNHFVGGLSVAVGGAPTIENLAMEGVEDLSVIVGDFSNKESDKPTDSPDEGQVLRRGDRVAYVGTSQSELRDRTFMVEGVRADGAVCFIVPQDGKPECLWRMSDWILPANVSLLEAIDHAPA